MLAAESGTRTSLVHAMWGAGTNSACGGIVLEEDEAADPVDRAIWRTGGRTEWLMRARRRGRKMEVNGLGIGLAAWVGRWRREGVDDAGVLKGSERP
jgi:hypothetical protein